MKLAEQILMHRQANADDLNGLQSQQEQLLDQTESPREHMKIIFGERDVQTTFNENTKASKAATPEN